MDFSMDSDTEFSINSHSSDSVVHCQQASSLNRFSTELKRCRWRMELMADGVGGDTVTRGEKLCSHLSQRFSYWVTAASRISFNSKYSSTLCFSHHLSLRSTLTASSCSLTASCFPKQIPIIGLLASGHSDNWVEQFPSLMRNSVPSVCWHSNYYAEKKMQIFQKVISKYYEIVSIGTAFTQGLVWWMLYIT